MQLVLDTRGMVLKVRNKCFFPMHGENKRQISPHWLSSIAVMTDCLISSSAVRLAVRNHIPIIFFDRSGAPEGRLWSPHFVGFAGMRRKLALLADSPEAGPHIHKLFRLKTEAQANNLKWLTKQARHTQLHKAALDTVPVKLDELKALCDAYPKNGGAAAIMGWEGRFARDYWAALSASLPEPWRFSSRSRRPALDNFNAALNYIYGMLYNLVERATLAAGLDPMMGILHADRTGQRTLVYDLIEPFRPHADRLLLGWCFSGKLLPEFFEPHEEGIWLAKAGRAFVLGSFVEFLHSKIDMDGENLSLQQHAFRLCAAMAKELREQEVKEECPIIYQ